jgi:multiple sugar transport system permease protein
MLYPVLWMVSSSLKEPSAIFTTAHALIPERVVFANYLEGWRGFGGISFATFFKNSLIVVSVSTVAGVFASSMVAYGLTRVRFIGRQFWFVTLMITLMLPYQVLMIPQYVLFARIGWVNSFKPVIVPHALGNAFFVFLIMQFIRTIPVELDESAIIDGCTKYSIYRRITLPLTKPALVTAAIFSFYWRWEDFVGPLLYLNNPAKYTVSLALQLFADPNAVKSISATAGIFVRF